MSLDPKFQAASEACQRWAFILAEFRNWADPTKTHIGFSRSEAAMVAFAKLYELRWELSQHGEALDAAFDQLAGIADIVIKHQGLFGESAWLSAHEAITEIARMAVLAVIETPGLGGKKVPADWQKIAEQQIARCWKGVIISFSEMQARIRQERVKLLAQRAPEPKGKSGGGRSKGTGRPPKKSVTVNERMAAMLLADPTRVDWSASAWAMRLSDDLKRPVSAAAVKQTDTWKKQIMAARALTEAKRAERGR